MNPILKDDEFEIVAESAKPDAKKRIVLPRTRAGVTYHIYANKLGQLILDPQVTIPASEAWFWEDAENVESFRRAIADVKSGRVHKVDLDDL